MTVSETNHFVVSEYKVNENHADVKVQPDITGKKI